jgi:energy-coupling factor transporter ATP-binding protein EcfA2
MSFWDRIRGITGKRRQRKVPILGVEASGKSSLVLTLGQFISLHQMGRVSMSSSTLFGDYLSYVAAGQPLPASTRWDKFGLHLERIPEPGGGFSDVDLLLSSEDIPGVDFRILVDELRANPNFQTWQSGGKSKTILERFTELLSSCDGFLFLIDLVRDTPAAELASGSREFIWKAFADQIKPIMTGILLATRMNAEMAQKPIFFVFSKPDLHKLPPAEVEEHFERGMAIPLAQLRGELINVRHYNVQCAGWEIDSALQGLGVDVLLSDLVHAVGAVRAPR